MSARRSRGQPTHGACASEMDGRCRRMDGARAESPWQLARKGLHVLGRGVWRGLTQISLILRSQNQMPPPPPGAGSRTRIPAYFNSALGVVCRVGPVCFRLARALCKRLISSRASVPRHTRTRHVLMPVSAQPSDALRARPSRVADAGSVAQQPAIGTRLYA